MLKVNTPDGEKTIDNLKISLLDSVGLCIPIYRNASRCQNFNQNTPTENRDKVKANSVPFHRKPQFWFAKDYYVTVINRMRLSEYGYNIRVKVEDKDGPLNQGNFKTRTIVVPRTQVLGLCGDWASLQPMEIILKPIKGQ